MSVAKLSPKVRLVFAAACVLQIIFVISLVTGFLNPLFVEAVEGHGQASDFFGIYQAGSNLLEGYSIYDHWDYENEAPQVVPFYYFYRYLPPTAYGAALLTLLFSPWTAYWVWMVLNEALLALVVLSILRASPWPRGRRWIAASLWLGFFPFYIEQIMGQFSFTMAVLLWVLWRYETPPSLTVPADSSGGWLGLRSVLGRWRRYSWSDDRAGPLSVLLTWSASVTVKSFSVLLAFPFLRDLRLKRILGAGALAAAVSLPYFAFRPADVVEFARLNFKPFPPIYKASMALRTMVHDIASQILPNAPEFFGQGLERYIVSASSGLVLILAIWATLRLRNVTWERTTRAGIDILLWVTAFFLTYKSIWEYHYVMLLPAVTAVYLATGSRAVLTLGVLLGLPTLYAATPLIAGVPAEAKIYEWPGWYHVLHYSMKVLPTLGLFLWCLAVAWRGGWTARTESA